MLIFTHDLALSVVPHPSRDDALVVRSPFRGDIERAFPGAQVERVTGGCYLYRAELSRARVAHAMAQLALELAAGDMLGQADYADPVRAGALNAAWSGMRAAASAAEPPTGAGHLATGQRFQHVTSDGRPCTVSVLLVQERMQGEPDVALEWSDTHHRATLRLSRAQRVLRDSALLA